MPWAFRDSSEEVPLKVRDLGFTRVPLRVEGLGFFKGSFRVALLFSPRFRVKGLRCFRVWALDIFALRGLESFEPSQAQAYQKPRRTLPNRA